MTGAKCVRRRIGRAEAGNTDTIAELMPALRARGVRAVSANGLLGDPAGAGTARGRRLLDGAAANLIATLPPR